MSSGMGIASVFVLSSFLLTGQASAEESQSFVSQKAARQASVEQAQTEMTAKTPNNEKTLEKSVNRGTSDTTEKS
jgi:hypothetical protein